MSDKVTCPGCGKALAPTTSGRYRKHGNGDCDFSGTVIPEDECQNESETATSETNAPSVPPKATDAQSPAESATSTTESSPTVPAAEDDASLPGVTEYTETLNDLATTQLAEYRARVDANLTPFSQPVPVEVETPTLFSQPLAVDQEVPGPSPASPAVVFSQPAGRKSEAPPLPMSADGAALAARLKELFYAYDNRRSSDNRSAQTTMGPSEMGTPCDRRLALSIMRMPPANPGSDGWAAFVGTCIHAGLEEMFLWANADTGRFAVEQRLEFPSDIVPKGTADLIDRTLFMLDDHKCQGRWSRNKLKSSGPSPTYRVQAHVYAYGARLRGERIEKIAIISWPRDEATLDDLYVHVEDYNPLIAKQAFERVDNIAAEVSRRQGNFRDTFPDAEDLEVNARVGAGFDVADDCRFCPFYLPNARDITRGCNGKR